MTTTTIEAPAAMPSTIRFTEAERLVFKPKEKITCSQWAGRTMFPRCMSDSGTAWT